MTKAALLGVAGESHERNADCCSLMDE